MTIEQRLIRIEQMLEWLTQSMTPLPADPKARLTALASIDPEASKAEAKALFRSTSKRRAA